MALLGRQRSGDAEIEQFRVANDGVEWRAELVRHHREKLRLGLARRLCLRSRRTLALELSLALDRSPAIGHVAERYEPRLFGWWRAGFAPLRVDHAQLGR